MEKKNPQAFQVTSWLNSINISSMIILTELTIFLPVQCPMKEELYTSEIQISLSSVLNRITTMKIKPIFQKQWKIIQAFRIRGTLAIAI